LLSVDVPDAGRALTAHWIGWDEAFFGYLRRRLSAGFSREPARVIAQGSLRALERGPKPVARGRRSGLSSKCPSGARTPLPTKAG
jgi:hypothetical protein